MVADATIASMLAQALASDPFYARVFAAIKPDTRPDAYFRAAIDEARSAGWIDAPPDGVSGAALWIEHHDSREALKRRDRIGSDLGPDALETYIALVASMSAVCGPYLPGDAIYLSILGVAPEARGRGLGSRLLAKGLARIDAMARPSCLETFNPLSVPFYQSVGFSVAACVNEPLTGCRVWVMTRPAASVYTTTDT